MNRSNLCFDYYREDKLRHHYNCCDFGHSCCMLMSKYLNGYPMMMVSMMAGKVNKVGKRDIKEMEKENDEKLLD